MSNKASPPQNQSIKSSLLTPWTEFINQTLTSNETVWSKFPKKELLKFSQSPSAPKIKQLLLMLPTLHKKYQQNCQHFRQLIILLYLLVLKGCINTSQQFINISLSVLQQLLSYRLIIVCSMLNKSSVIVQVYDYMQNWFNLLVPAILANSSMQFGKQKDKKKMKEKTKEKEVKNKTLISVLYFINKKQEIGFDRNEKGLDQLLIIFEGLLVSKIRNYLAHGSLFQFDNIMRKIYTTEKFKIIYQGRGCVSHISNKEKQKKEKQKQLMENSYISIMGLVPVQLDEQSCQIYELQFQLPPIQNRGEQSKIKKSNSLKLKKIPSQPSSQLPPWVIDAFKPNIKPNPIKITLKIMLNKMKAMEMYKFLCLLEIYGGSPNIQQLNQFIPDYLLLEFFSKFLRGQNLVEMFYSFDGVNKQNMRYRNAMEYSYKNEKMSLIMERCMNEAFKLQAEIDRNLFIQEFKTKLLGSGSENNGQGKAYKGKFQKENQGNTKSLTFNNGKIDDPWKK